MNNKRVFHFAFAGLLVALVLQAVGYRMDLAVPHIKMGDQVHYNCGVLCELQDNRYNRPMSRA